MKRLITIIAILLFVSISVAWAGILPISNLHSTTHTPNQWSNKREISFAWDSVSDAIGFSYILDKNSTTEPDGTSEIQDGSATSVTLNTPSYGEFYFHIRAIGGSGELGDVAHIGPFKIDPIAPAKAASFTATPEDKKVILSWVTPASADFSKVIIRYNIASSSNCNFPENENAGTLVIEDTTTGPGENATYTHIGLTNGKSYCYAAFSCDKAGNCARAVTKEAIPNPIIKIYSVSPSQAYNNVTYNIIISGENFNSTTPEVNNTQVKLELSTTSKQAKDVQIISNNKLNATFDLFSLPSGNYTLCVKDVCKENVFTINNSNDENNEENSSESNGGGGGGVISIPTSSDEDSTQQTEDNASTTLLTIRERAQEFARDGKVDKEEIMECLNNTNQIRGEDIRSLIEAGVKEFDLEDIEIEGDVEIPEDVTVKGGKIRGEVRNKGVMKEIKIEMGSIVHNQGKMENIEVKEQAVIQNQGEIKNLRIRMRSRIIGGTISGNVTGDVDIPISNFGTFSETTSADEIVSILPVVENATIVVNSTATSFKKVVLKDIKFEIRNRENLHFGLGTVFSVNSLKDLARQIDYPIDLSQMVPAYTPDLENIEGQLKILMADFPVLIDEYNNSSETVLDMIKDSLAQYDLDSNISIDEESGTITIELPDYNQSYTFCLNKIELPSLNETDTSIGNVPSGGFEFRKDYLNIDIVPFVSNLKQFSDMISSYQQQLSLECEMNEDGSMTFAYKVDNSTQYLSAIPTGEVRPAIIETENTQVSLDENGNIVIVYPDGIENVLVPYPIGYSTLKDSLHNMGFDTVFDPYQNCLVVKYQNWDTYTFRIDYNYTPLSDEEKDEVMSVPNKFVVIPEGDNFYVLTPQGKQLYIPVE